MMNTGVFIAILSSLTSTLVAIVGFYLTRKKEREGDWRKIKFEHYREFMIALSSIVGSDATPDGHKRFAHATNTVHLVASSDVIDTMHRFREEISCKNPSRSYEREDEILSLLLRQMREDLGMPHQSNPLNLPVQLWTSGVSEAREAKAF